MRRIAPVDLKNPRLVSRPMPPLSSADNAAAAGWRESVAWHLHAARCGLRVAPAGGTAYLMGREIPRPVDPVVQVHALAGGTP
jgi:hypothetical protein